MLQIDGRLVFLLPGPPGEMQAMFEVSVLPLLRERAGGQVICTRILKIASMGESDVEQLVAPVYTTFSNPRTTILGAPGQVELHLTAEGPSQQTATDRIEALASAIRTRLAGRIFSEDGRELNQVVAGLLQERGLTLALAESCTGGMLAARLTDVTYSNQSKVDLLGVDAGLLETFGAVSEQVARAMADGARRAAASHLGLGITGIAGPAGATPDKPLGLVYIALTGVLGDRLRRLHFPGGRERVRHQACQAALEMLRRGLLGLSDA
jgi:nicotinamide-nucleotide amidase